MNFGSGFLSKALMLIILGTKSLVDNLIEQNELFSVNSTLTQIHKTTVRRKRIAKGSGVDVSKINKLLKQFKMMSDMMKKMSQEKKIPSGMIPDEMLNQLKWKV